MKKKIGQLIHQKHELQQYRVASVNLRTHVVCQHGKIRELCPARQGILNKHTSLVTKTRTLSIIKFLGPTGSQGC